jgi:hypothetical protein
MLMDMSEMMLWSIVMLLLCSGRAMTNEWSFHSLCKYAKKMDS